MEVNSMKKSMALALVTMAAAAALTFPAMASDAGAVCKHITAAGGTAYGGCELCESDPVAVRGYLCKVIYTMPERDSFMLMDCTGNTWEYSGIEDTEPGDFYSVVFNTHGTADVTDDSIISITYERPDLFF